MPECIPLNPRTPRMFSEEPEENDERIFEKITSIHLTPEQIDRIVNPSTTFPRQENVLAVHWHPEHISLHLIEQRIQRTFPNRKETLIIPTQHNELLSFHEYVGVEMDAYSKGFNQKVQLLLHFHVSRIQSAHVLQSMLAYTFQYRKHQMNRFLEALIESDADIIETAASETGANDECIRFVRAQMRKLNLLIERHYDKIPIGMFKNKLLRDFLDEYRQEFGDAWINRAQIFLHAVKQLVKEQFPLRYFYRTSEIIEEARSLGGGIVIPHPEQFWPILLADYDVDGYEIWNPQSRRYTEFLISVVNRKNAFHNRRDKRLLLFMGDDTHMGEKVRDPDKQDLEKAQREIGVQPAWEDMDIRKALIAADMSRKRVIEEYKARLGQEPVKSDPKQQMNP